MFKQHPHDPPPLHKGIFSTPLPPTGHPLGALARAWLVLNCMILIGLLTGVLITGVAHFAWLWTTGKVITDPTATRFFTAGLGVGLFLGLLLGGWLALRMGRRSAGLLLATLSLIPLVGPIVGTLTALAMLASLARKKWRERNEAIAEATDEETAAR